MLRAVSLHSSFIISYHSSLTTHLFPIAEHLAPRDGAEGLISDGINAAGEEMNRAVAEQEVRSLRVLAVKRIGVVNREVGAGQMCGVAMGEDEGLVEVRIVVGGSGGRSVGLGGGYGRVPSGASAARHGAGPGAGGMVTGAL